MIRKFIIAAGVAALMASPSFAAPCKDAKGKFIKCPTAVKAVPAVVKTTTPTNVKATVKTTKVKTTTTGRCRNAKGQFAKCGTPGARPA